MLKKLVDITSCMFHPPGYNPKDSEIQLKINETIEYSIGDIDEEGGISDKLNHYQRPMLKSKMHVDVVHTYEETLDPLDGQHVELSARTHSTSPMLRKGVPRFHEHKHVSTREGSLHSPASKPSPPVSIPYIRMSKMPKDDGEFTLIYFHANSEDIFKSLILCRYLQKVLRVGSYH